MTEMFKEELSEHRTILDRHAAAWINGYRMLGGTVYCADRCAACCTLAVNCTWPESQAIAEILPQQYTRQLPIHLHKLQQIVARSGNLASFLRNHRQIVGGCPFLAASSCSIYEDRPLSCRALLSTMDSKWCAADFSAMSSSEKQDFMARLDRNVADFPTHYGAATRETGQQLESAITDTMLERYGFSLYGNLPLLVLLNISHDLAETVSQGYAATVALLQREGVYHPFLVTLSEKGRELHAGL